MIVWLADRPDDEDGHLKLLWLARGVPNRLEAAEALAQTLSWLDGNRGGTETWIALFSLVRAMSRNLWAPEVCATARQWLAEHPDDLRELRIIQIWVRPDARLIEHGRALLHFVETNIAAPHNCDVVRL